VITVELPPDRFAVDINDSAAVVILSEVPPDLQQVGIGIGSIVSIIDGPPAYDYIAAAEARSEGVLSREPTLWGFIVGGKTIQVMLIFRADVTPSVEALARAPAAPAAPASAVVDAEPDPEPIDSGDAVIRVHFRVVGDQVSSDSIVIDIDKGARTVVVGGVSADLGVAVGAVCTAINDKSPYAFLKGGLPNGEVLSWDFAVGERTVRLGLVFTEPASEAAEAPASEGEASFLDFRCEDWDSPDFSFPRPAPAPWHKPMFANLPEIPITDRQYHERPPRKMAVHWELPSFSCNPDYVYHHYDAEQDIYTRKR
jgi:hypothetical protein